MNTQKGFSTIWVILAILILGGGAYYYANNNESQTDEVSENAESEIIEEEYNINHTDTKAGKSSYSSQEEQTAARAKAAGITDLRDKNGILFALEPERPYFPKYKLPINVTGYVSDVSKWNIFEGEAGVVYLVDDNDDVLAQSILTLKNYDYDKTPPFYFDVTLGDFELTYHLDTDTSYYVVFKENEGKDEDIIDEVKVPVDLYLGYILNYSDISECDEMEDSDVSQTKDLCYLGFALDGLDSEICSYMSFESNRNRCYGVIAFKTGDTGLCEYTEDYEDICISNIENDYYVELRN